MIRDASIYDIPRIYELGSLLNDNFQKVNNLNEMLEDQLTKVIVYETDDQIVGFITATDLVQTCDILSLVVDPNYRKQGVATNLIGYLIGDLSEELELITLEVNANNKEAIALYDKFGFEIVNVRTKYYGNDDAYLMARKSE